MFLRGRKLNISLVFISNFFLKEPKPIRINVTNYFITKIPNKRKLHQIASNHLSDLKFKDFMKFCKDCAKQPYLILVKDTTLASDNLLRFRKNL